MEAKLKLITDKIHWFLIFKTLILSLIWAIFPFWIFLLTFLLFYFIPVFRPGSMFFSFLIFIFIANFLPFSFWNFLIIFALIFLIFGIKDLIIINRVFAYEFLGFLSFLVLVLSFFEKFGKYIQIQGIFYSFVLILIYFLFFKKIIHPEIIFLDQNLDLKKFKLFLAVFSFFLWQIILVLNILPLNFYLQTALLILFASIGFEFILNYFIFKITSKKILSSIITFLVFFIFILFLNKWSL